MKRLPIDLSTFSELIRSNYLYVDKTKYAYDMITGGRRFFLSRPRRFGKSLFVSTLNEILTAKRDIFDGLSIAQSDYEWKEHGVINLDFSTFTAYNIAYFQEGLRHELLTIAQDYDIFLDLTINDVNVLFKALVKELSKKYGRVAILVDEYDSPILKNLYNEALAREIRDIIQQFFTVIKGLDAQIQFVFITGVSSFAKAGLFSGINNLQILTLDKRFAAVCGYTDSEIDHYFIDYITAWSEQENIPFDTLRLQIKDWYNGYSFGKNVSKVYNPFSLMRALNIQELSNFWFQSGTPTFLVEVLKNEHSFSPDEFSTTEDNLGIFDVGLTPLTTLMFQAGYLTMVGYDIETQLYQLDYPNVEVKVSFQKYLLEVFAHIESSRAAQLSVDLKTAFIAKDIDKVILLLQQLFAHVPYQLHVPAEKYYHSLFMMMCVGANIKAQSEYSTNLGRIDLTLEFQKIIYVIEVKFNDTAENALKQIEEMDYYRRFISQGKEIILLGLAFKRAPAIFDITYAVKKVNHQ